MAEDGTLQAAKWVAHVIAHGALAWEQLSVGVPAGFQAVIFWVAMDILGGMKNCGKLPVNDLQKVHLHHSSSIFHVTMLGLEGKFNIVQPLG